MLGRDGGSAFLTLPGAASLRATVVGTRLTALGDQAWDFRDRVVSCPDPPTRPIDAAD